MLKLRLPWLCLCAVLNASCAAGMVGAPVAQTGTGLSNEYYQLDDGAKMHVIRASAQRYKLILAINPDRKLQTVQEFALQNPRAQAIINAGFFGEKGDPSGFFKYRGKWWSGSRKPRAVLGIGQWQDRQVVFIDRLQKRHGQLHAWWGSEAWWRAADNIVGGAPVLLIDGKKVDFHEEALAPEFVENRYARSAFCLTTTGDMLMVHVAGSGKLMHKLGRRQGMSLAMLADQLQALGCADALNLDGGGSAVLMTGGKVIAANSFWWWMGHPISNVLMFEPV